MKNVKIKNELLDEQEKLKKKTNKSYRERVNQRMCRHYKEKLLKKPRKSRKNNTKEIMYISHSSDVHVVKRKITKAAPLVKVCYLQKKK